MMIKNNGKKGEKNMANINKSLQTHEDALENEHFTAATMQERADEAERNWLLGYDASIKTLVLYHYEDGEFRLYIPHWEKMDVYVYDEVLDVVYDLPITVNEEQVLNAVRKYRLEDPAKEQERMEAGRNGKDLEGDLW